MDWWNEDATRRWAGGAYDLVLVGIGFWFLYAAAAGNPWLPWGVFIVVNLAGLFLFNNRLFAHRWWLTNGWTVFGSFAVMLIAGAVVFVFGLDPLSRIMAVVALALMAMVRLTMRAPEWEGQTPLSRTYWIDAVKSLHADPTAKVLCPQCGRASLEVTDVPVASGGVERRMKCPSCRAWNTILMGDTPAGASAE